MKRRTLTPEQEAESQLLAAKIREKIAEDVLEIARGMVARPDEEILGKGEFEIRDQVHRIGAKALELQLDERKKGVPRS